MTILKLGDLVVLKSGGPVMTVDAINTDIFDDSKFTGVVCVWFAGDKLQRVRFDYRAVELAGAVAKPAAPVEQVGAYKDVLDSMMAEMNDAAAALDDQPRTAKARAAKPAATKSRTGKTERAASIEQTAPIGRA